MTSVKRTQRKDVQKAYRVRNWREYETGLRARGSLTVWLGLTDGKRANWNSPRPTRRKPGRQCQYSNHGLCQVNIARTGFASDEIATQTLDLDTRRLTPDPEATFA